ncbi:MAG: F0F1 ATP synthase subunit delta [Collinsella sp.]|nr:F0F1 ATP synthase subunit delta [Collinsella sp.]
MPNDRLINRKLETYARTLFEAAKAEDRVYEDLEPLQAEATASPEVLSVISTMGSNGDLDLIPQVLEMYRDMIDGEKEVVGVHVTTAIPLDDELRALIKGKCEADLENEVFLIEHVDPSIIGGIVLSVRGQRRDASVRMQLETARKVMTQNVKRTEV